MVATTLLLLVGGIGVAAALIYTEWQRIELERGVTAVADIQKIRPFTTEAIRAAVVKYINDQGAQVRPGAVEVAIERGDLPDRDTARLGDQIREQAAGRVATITATVTIAAQVEVRSFGWTRPVRLDSVQHVRVAPELLARVRVTQRRPKTAPASQSTRPSLIRPGMEPLLGLLGRHRAALARGRGRRLSASSRRSISAGLAALREPIERGELFWLRDATTLVWYVATLQALSTAPDPRAAWTTANAAAQRLSDRLARLGVYTPPVDPSATPAPQ